MDQSLQALLFQSLNEHSYQVLLLAFLGGVASSLLPCTVGMLPILVGYVGGYSEDSRWTILQQIACFIVGFALVLTALGITASVLGTLMAALIGPAWFYVLGGVAILMGLHLLGFIHVPLPRLVARMPKTQAGKILTPLLLGAAFGTASSSCGTPFLTAILGFVSREQNGWLGGAALFLYALGQSLLLLIAGIFTGLLRQIAVLRHVGAVVTRVSALIFVLAGLYLIAQAAGWIGGVV